VKLNVQIEILGMQTQALARFSGQKWLEVRAEWRSSQIAPLPAALATFIHVKEITLQEFTGGAG
jgi:hypothetical protein